MKEALLLLKDFHNGDVDELLPKLKEDGPDLQEIVDEQIRLGIIASLHEQWITLQGDDVRIQMEGWHLAFEFSLAALLKETARDVDHGDLDALRQTIEIVSQGLAQLEAAAANLSVNAERPRART